MEKLSLQTTVIKTSPHKTPPQPAANHGVVALSANVEIIPAAVKH